MRKRRFKDPQMQRAYDAAVENAETMKVGSGVDRDFFKRGYSGIRPDRHPPRNSLSYAIFVAGQDVARSEARSKLNKEVA